jgi:hypothetical protein
MKSRLITLLLLVCAIVAVGCGDDTTTNSSGNAGMSAKVNGSSWSPGTVQPMNVGGSLQLMGIEMNGGTSRQMQITITGAAVGDFTLGGVSGGFGKTLSYTETAGSTVKIFSATSGTVKITEYTATGAKGTFTATVEGTNGATGTHTISEGSFDVKF